MKNNFVRGGIVVIAVLIVIIAMSLLSGPLTMNSGEKEEVTFDQFLSYVDGGTVQQIAVNTGTGTLVGVSTTTKVKDSSFPKDYDFTCAIPSQQVLNEELNSRAARKLGVTKDEVNSSDWGFKVQYIAPTQDSIWSLLIPNLIIIAIIGVMWFVFMRQMQGGNNKAMNFGRSRARMADDSDKKVTFADVAGAEEEKEELAEIVDFLRKPAKFRELGARIPKGVLLVGPPGTGKTWLARAVAGEAGVPFFTISGSDFVELYVGVGASRVRDLFERAKHSSPCIIFIDEIDAVGRQRGAGLGGGHDEREQTLNQLLVEMDGFAANEGIIILAATNRPDILDPALLRPGRFDRRVTVGYPDIQGRAAVLRIHAKGKPLAEDVDMEEIARMTSWFTPADLENVLNEAAILSARRGAKAIDRATIIESITRVQMGPEKRSHKVTDKDRKLVACHEAGHALVAEVMPLCDPVKEVSIIPRGSAGGYTQTLSEEDNEFVSSQKLRDDLAMMLGGHVAEQVLLGDVSTGSSSDLQRASEIARKMITEYGMSAEIGPMYMAGDKEVFIGRDYGHTRNTSEELAAKIDAEMKKMLLQAQQRAERAIRENLPSLNRIIDALLKQEKIDGKDFRRIVRGEEAAVAPETFPQPEGV
ncbi:MAG: ATP-dependent zinc metalloprotease FtsH [Eubacteriales bacterium]|nr:ATP-dependent zinc metalloprotease FtsH [Eubacteriales bacterium]